MSLNRWHIVHGTDFALVAAMLRSVLIVLCLSLFSAPSLAQRGSSVQAWFQARDGQFRTYEFREGRRTRRDGLFIRAGDSEVELVIETVSADAWDCESFVEVQTERRVHGLRLVAVRGTDREVLLEWPIEFNTWVDDEIIIHGSMGPFVSVERRADYGAVCSAHAFPLRTFHWFDLRDGGERDRDEVGHIEVEAPPGCDAQLAESEQQLWSEYRRAVSESGMSTDGSRAYGGFVVEGVVPRLDNGRWRARVHVALGVPYAWTRGYSHNQIESHFDVANLASWIPEPLTQIPRVVSRFDERHPGIRFGGVSARRQ